MNARLDASRSAVRPSVTAATWTRMPQPEEIADTHAASRPCDKPRAIARMLSGPGATTRAMHAMV